MREAIDINKLRWNYSNNELYIFSLVTTEEQIKALIETLIISRHAYAIHTIQWNLPHYILCTAETKQRIS
jgi:hypothetical protein